jgi:hypothetical protein
LLVISGSTSRKFHRHPSALRCEDFADAARFARRERELASWMLPAEEMYAGAQHLLTRRAIGRLREAWGEERVAWRVLSAGYGLVAAVRPIAPYACDLATYRNDLAGWSDRVGLADGLRRALRGHDLVILLLGRHYLAATLAALPAAGADAAACLIVSAPAAVDPAALPPRSHVLPAGRERALEERVNLVALKGHLFDLLARTLADAGPAAEARLAADPSRADGLIGPMLRSRRQGRLL